jgi:hypothetical protein
MSDLAAAAAAMGVPEALVKRSAEARARATGASVDEILAAWAGGGEAPAAAASPSPAAQAEATSPAPDASAEGAETPPEAQPAPDQEDARRQTPDANQQPRIPASAVPAAPPILVGDRQGVGVVMSGSVGLLVLSLLLSVFLPAMQQPGNGIRSSNHAYSSEAENGQDIYASQGCATCHTQLIRNVVTDVGLGPVTLDDTNQVIGYRRIGPDLAAIGERMEDTAALIALLAGTGNHPAASGLSEAEVANLLAYLRESR